MYFECCTCILTFFSARCKAMCDANLCKLTSWVSDPVEELMVVELAKFAACHGIRDFITELTTASHCSLSWARLIHSTSFNCIYLVFTLRLRRFYTRFWLQRSELDPFACCGGQSGKTTSGFPLSVSFYLSYTLIYASPTSILSYWNSR
jgi:hypothetical protein